MCAPTGNCISIDFTSTDFSTLKELTSHADKDAKCSTGSNSKGEGAAKSRYRTLHQQRVIERRNHRAAELRYLEALEQERFYLEQVRTDNFPVFVPDLVLPPLRLGVSGIENPPPFRLPPPSLSQRHTRYVVLG